MTSATVIETCFSPVSIYIWPAPGYSRREQVIFALHCECLRDLFIASFGVVQQRQNLVTLLHDIFARHGRPEIAPGSRNSVLTRDI